VTLTRTSLRGVWGTVLLPLDDRDEIEWDRLEEQVDRLAASELDGVYAHGTAGEFHTLTEDEFDRITAMLAAACRHHGKPFQIGASHPVAGTTIQRITRARPYEPDAFQVVLPDWLPMSDPECESFLRGVARAAGQVPLVLYNPPHAKTRVGPALYTRLLEAVPELIGIKVAGGNADWYAAMAGVLSACAVFIPGHTMATGLAHGARGSYSNVAALSPDGAARWFRTIHDDPSAGADLERRVSEFFAQHVAPLERRGISAPALDKFLAAVGGWSDGGLRIRWPYDSVPAECVGPARDSARALLPELIAQGPAVRS
jgi:dihydrodipicolinate synthase/N-acetylneuraminate lyase